MKVTLVTASKSVRHSENFLIVVLPTASGIFTKKAKNTRGGAIDLMPARTTSDGESIISWCQNGQKIGYEKQKYILRYLVPTIALLN